MRAGSYVFDPDLVRFVIIKWEGDSDVVHGIEPFAHLSPALDGWATDRRFLEPMQDLVGSDDPVLFTEKLNLKRPHHGGVNPLHQDYPYWVGVAQDPAEVATAMLFLDDATLDNGCLHVVPGSHKSGVWSTRDDGDQFAGNEIAVDAYPDVILGATRAGCRLDGDVRLVPGALLGAEPVGAATPIAPVQLSACGPRPHARRAAQARRHTPSMTDTVPRPVTTISDVARAARVFASDGVACTQRHRIGVGRPRQACP